MKTKEWVVPKGFSDTVATNLRPDPDGPTGIIWDAIAEGLSPRNAKLISASKELKHASEVALDLMEAVQWNDDDIQPEWDEALVLLKKALKKAGK